MSEKPTQLQWWVISPDNLAEIDEIMRPVQEEATHMSEAEINAIIDEAIAEVRRDRARKNNQ